MNIFNTSVHTDIPQNRERTFIICFKDEADWEVSNKQSCSKKFSEQLPLSKSKKKKNFRELLEKGDVHERFYYKQDAYMYKDLKKVSHQKIQFINGEGYMSEKIKVMNVQL